MVNCGSILILKECKTHTHSKNASVFPPVSVVGGGTNRIEVGKVQSAVKTSMPRAYFTKYCFVSANLRWTWSYNSIKRRSYCTSSARAWHTDPGEGPGLLGWHEKGRCRGGPSWWLGPRTGGSPEEESHCVLHCKI